MSAAHAENPFQVEAVSGVVRIPGRGLVPPAVVGPLLEGLQVGDGEVVVRVGAHTTRIFIARGAIAWVVSDEVPYRLSHVLESVAGIPRSALRPVVDECLARKANLGETLLKRGWLDPELLRRCMLIHNAHHFVGLLRDGEDVVARFERKTRAYASELLFDVPEILGAVAHLMDSVPSPSSALLDSLARLGDHTRGCRALIALHCLGGAQADVLGAWPASLAMGPSLAVGRAAADLLDGPLAHAVLGSDERLLPSEEAGEIREVVLMDPHGFRVVLRPPDRSYALLAVVDGSSNLGLVLARLRAGVRAMDWPD